MHDQNNVFYAVALSLVILITWQYFFATSFLGKPSAPKTSQTGVMAPRAAIPSPQQFQQFSRQDALARSQRVAIDTPRVKGSIALTGGRIDDLSLVQYRETTDPKSPAIQLLSPSGSPQPFYAEFGWINSSGINLQLPSGSQLDFGNIDFDVNLIISDAATDPAGQYFFDIFDTDGFLGDLVFVNMAYAPFMEVLPRKYRFRILNGAVSRFFKISLSDASPMIQIANDGNLLPNPVTITQTDQLGIAERYDIVIDFSRYSIGQTVSMVNLLAHEDGTEPSATLSLSSALNGSSTDPCVGRFLEFRIVRNPAQPDQSQVPAVMIPNPDLSAIPVARTRTFTFGDGATQNTNDPVTSFRGPWGIGTDGGEVLDADFGRISAAPSFGTREIWNLVNDGGGWDHPVHIHFEEGQILKRNGSASNVPAWEKGRKDVYRLRPDGSVQLTMQFRDFGGMFMEHCHNTLHEDNAMLLRWEIDDGGSPFLRPLPTPIPTPQGVRFQPPTVLKF